jgi:hypothetical protein
MTFPETKFRCEAVECVGEAFRQIPLQSIKQALIELDAPKTSAQNSLSGAATLAVDLRFKEKDLRVTNSSKNLETTTYILIT